MAVAKDKLIKVMNRYSGKVGYDIPDSTLISHRDYYPGETKEVPFEELEKVAATPQGRIVLQNYLIIKDYDAVKELLPDVEPEYYYTEEDIKKLLTTPNNYDAFLDCLDFAPDGVIDLIKDLAVSLPVNDLLKRQYIQQKTGFDVNNAIDVANAKYDGDSDAEELPEGAPHRRTAAPTVADKPQRRVTVIKK